MAIVVSVKGVHKVNEELLRAARRYQSKAQTRKLLRPAGVTARKHLKDMTRASMINAENSTGTLVRSIRTFSFTRSRSVHVGPRVGSGLRGLADGFYFGFHDLGTKHRISRRQHIRPKNIIKRMLGAFGSAIGKQIEALLIADLKFLT